MSKTYSPPYKVTPAIISLVAQISNKLGRISALEDVSKKLRLHRVNRLKTIQGSLAIEGNSLDIEQITAIVEGKRIIAPPREILEVKNAFKAYDHLEKWNPFMEKDLLEAHRILMAGLLDDAGKYRRREVGVIAGGKIKHIAPPAKRVPRLMRDLMQWLKITDQHPLISSSVFHYEFEFIHPFQDGNGRIGRLWQTLSLVKFDPLFIAVPVESLVYEHQADYYTALAKSTKNGESSAFIEFMLNMILGAFKSLPAPEVNPEVTPEVKKLLLAMSGEMSRRQIQLKLGLKDEKHFREAYQRPAIAAGFIEMTIPDKPNSKLQKYRLTSRGAALANAVKI